MANVPGEADRLLRAGRNKILRVCLLWGVPLLVILVFAGLQYAGTVRLEEYLAAEPARVDPRVIWRALALLALFQLLFVALGVLQGWGAIRRARQLRQESAPGTSKGASEGAR